MNPNNLVQPNQIDITPIVDKIQDLVEKEAATVELVTKDTPSGDLVTLKITVKQFDPFTQERKDDLVYEWISSDSIDKSIEGLDKQKEQIEKSIEGLETKKSNLEFLKNYFSDVEDS